MLKTYYNSLDSLLGYIEIIFLILIIFIISKKQNILNIFFKFCTFSRKTIQFLFSTYPSKDPKKS